MSRRNRLFLLICSLLALFTLIYCIFLLNRVEKPSLSTSTQPPPYRACIVSLIKSDPLISLNKLLNMLNSLRLYFSNIDRYPIYLFHEPTLTNETINRIRSCSSSLNITFYEIHFDVTIPSNRSGYASMCQFWSYDIWFSIDIIREQCDYVMRFDDDSYLTNQTPFDLFEEFTRRQLDYVYRIIYHDSNGLAFLRDNLQLFLPMRNDTQSKYRRGCIEGLCTHLNGPYGYDGLAVYNNFFILRVKLFQEYPIVEQYLQQLISINAFYRYPIGDANVQTICLLLIEKPPKIAHFNFPYNHNVHGGSSLYPSFEYFINTAFMWYNQMKHYNVTCDTIIVATKYTVIKQHV